MFHHCRIVSCFICAVLSCFQFYQYRFFLLRLSSVQCLVFYQCSVFYRFTVVSSILFPVSSIQCFLFSFISAVFFYVFYFISTVSFPFSFILAKYFFSFQLHYCSVCCFINAESVLTSQVSVPFRFLFHQQNIVFYVISGMLFPVTGDTQHCAGNTVSHKASLIIHVIRKSCGPKYFSFGKISVFWVAFDF